MDGLSLRRGNLEILHRQAIQHLESQYMQYITVLLEQKSEILLALNQKFAQEMHALNDVMMIPKTIANPQNAPAGPSEDNQDISADAQLGSTSEMPADDVVIDEFDGSIPPEIPMEEFNQSEEIPSLIPLDAGINEDDEQYAQHIRIAEEQSLTLNSQKIVDLTNTDSRKRQRVVSYQSHRTGSEQGTVSKRQKMNDAVDNVKNTVTKSRAFQCDECGKKLPTQMGLQSHKNYHRMKRVQQQSGTQYRCPECGKVFDNGLSLNGHRGWHQMQRTKAKNTTATVPPMRLKVSVNKKEAEGQHASSGSLKCQRCSQQFKSTQHLMEHLASSHSLQGIRSSKKEGRGKSKTTAHLPFVCQHCGSRLKNWKCLGIHVAETHPQNAAMIFSPTKRD